MIPEEKAKELIGKFEDVDDCDKHYNDRYSPCSHQAKQCAIICAEQVIEWERLNFGANTRATNLWNEVIEHIKNS